MNGGMFTFCAKAMVSLKLDTGQIWETHGLHLGAIWAGAGDNLGYIWGRSGLELGPIWGRSGLHLGWLWAATYRPHMGCIWVQSG